MSKIKEKMFCRPLGRGGFLGVVIIACDLYLVDVHWSDRLPLLGNSMSRVFPWGSVIVILPFGRRRGL